MLEVTVKVWGIKRGHGLMYVTRPDHFSASMRLTVSSCGDSGCFPPEVSETAAWNPTVYTTESEMMKYFSGPV